MTDQQSQESWFKDSRAAADDELEVDSADDTTAAASPSKRRKGRRFMVIFFTTLLVVLLAGGAVFGWYLHRVGSAVDKIRRDPSLMPSGSEVRPPEATSEAKQQPLTFVLMGSDSRGEDQGRSDSLMVAYLSGDRKNVYLVSFPRDMWVEIPGKGKAKINAAYSWGGPPLTIKTMEKLTGVRMNHAAVIDFPGFIKLTDVLGGVTVNNPHASATGRYNFPQGWITVRGEAALTYVRERKNLPNGDLDRAARQRSVVQAIMKKSLSPEVLANPSTFGSMIDTFAACMTVDEGLDKTTIHKVATSLRVDPETGIHSLQAPISGFGTSSDGQAIDLVDEAKLAELSTAMRTDTMAAYVAKHQK